MLADPLPLAPAHSAASGARNAPRRNDLSIPAPGGELAALRIPPHSLEAEQSLLGGLLLENEAYDRIGGLVQEGDLYRHEHRLIFAALTALIQSGKPADVITVFDYLQARGRGEEAGGLNYLNSLAQSMASAANLRRYAEIVRERAVLRQLISAGDAIATAAFNPQGRSVSQILDEAEREVFRIGESSERMKSGVVPMQELAQALAQRVEELRQNTSDITGVPTGFVDLDRMTSGLQKSDLIVLAARPGMGKTALALNIASYAALDVGLPVIVFSMEMSAEQLGLRITGAVGEIDQTRLRKGRINDEEQTRLIRTLDRLREAPLYIDETAALTPAELRAKARRLARQFGQLGMVVVDYIQLMNSGQGDTENRATEVAQITRQLKALAKELNCPVLAISQLNRAVEKRGDDKKPVMSDLRESGAIEQDADIILFLYHGDTEQANAGQVHLAIAKHRNGPTGQIELIFRKSFTRFHSAARGGEEE